ncbi:MAG: LysR family transcriptional regulator [Pseudomonadota bacterium]|nr:LysR family transcriptional regulator [Pseudomonadota bacterium]
MSIRAEVSFASSGASRMGKERVRLLEAVGREGSISAAARATGVSYKAAWDAITAMNNLVGQPLVAAQTGWAARWRRGADRGRPARRRNLSPAGK